MIGLEKLGHYNTYLGRYNVYLGFIIISIILFLLVFALFISFQIAINFVYLWIKLIYEPFADKISEYTKELAFILTILVIIGLVIGGFQIFGFKFDDIIPQFFVAFIILIITSWRKILEMIYLILNKVLKKTKGKSAE